MSNTGEADDSPNAEVCQTCEVRDYGGDGSLIPVWEDPEDYREGEGPDYIGCTDCHTMEPVGGDQ